ncbi:MAG: ketol-acid reductoisomerase [bacterium JZ-2024 1]
MKPTSFSSVGIIGYGNQGRAQALNARDAGFPVHIFVRPGGRSEGIARSDGFSPYPIGSDVANVDAIVLLTPDHTHHSVLEEIVPHLHSGQAVIFAHGFSVHYQEAHFPDFVDVLLVAPKAVGWVVRESFLSAQGFPCILAVHQDASGLARKRAEEYATLIGGNPLFWSTFQQETETDLFTEQVLLVGGLMELLLATYDVLTENAVLPELAYLETVGELQYMAQLLNQKGIKGLMESISPMARMGGATRGPQVIDHHTREKMRQIFQSIRTGQFYREWKSTPPYSLEKYYSHPLEDVYQKMRKKE